MSKRHLSSPPLPLPKRHGHGHAVSKLTFDGVMYDELILCIFAHLSWSDLCAMQAINRKMARLATDNELWRKLYSRVYGRTRLRGSRGFIGRSDGREVKPLPGGARTDDARGWKCMFRISHNWRKGRCNVELFPSQATISLAASPDPKPTLTHILLTGPYIITADSRPSSQPSIWIASPSGVSDRLVCASTEPDPFSITSITMDQAPPLAGHMRLAAFMSSGEFTVFLIKLQLPFPPSHTSVYRPNPRTSRTTPVIQAVYHHPLLVTLSQSFSLSIYDLSGASIRHAQTLTSFTSFPPTSLVLSVLTPTTYKLVSAYTIPVYPAHWSVGATELIISGHTVRSGLPSSSSEALSLSPFPGHRSDETFVHGMHVITTRTARALDVPQGWIDERKLRVMREQWNRKLRTVGDTQTDGKWVVLAPGNDAQEPAASNSSETTSDHGLSSPTPTSSSSLPIPEIRLSSSGIYASPLYSSTGLQLYRLHLPLASSSVSSPPPKLTFVRTLYGQSGPVAALALADGRCVSLGRNGSIWVWDLEAGSGAEVAAAENVYTDYNLVRGSGTVAFDERRIVTVHEGNVVIRRFDI